MICINPFKKEVFCFFFVCLFLFSCEEETLYNTDVIALSQFVNYHGVEPRRVRYLIEPIGQQSRLGVGPNDYHLRAVMYYYPSDIEKMNLQLVGRDTSKIPPTSMAHYFVPEWLPQTEIQILNSMESREIDDPNFSKDSYKSQAFLWGSNVIYIHGYTQ